MPGRISRSSVPQSFSTKRSRSRPGPKQNRSLDAFAIASEADPRPAKFRKHRLGESDLDGEPQRKRRRRSNDEQEDGDDQEEPQDGRGEERSRPRREFDGLDANSGSDSDGNEWHFGFDQDAGDEDEEIDSDEAFGESDEERFEGYTFRGSSTRRKSKPKKEKASRPGVDLNEDDDASAPGEEDGESDSSLGSDAVDLATMLDDPAEGNVSNTRPHTASLDGDSDNASFQDFSKDGSDDDDDSDDQDGPDPARLTQLRNLVDSLEKADHDSDDDDDSGADVKPGALLAAVQKVANGDKKPSRKDKRGADKHGDAALSARLPKRQQDKLNREVAYRKATETLGRWQDTVKHNRRADHLMFPLQDPNVGEALGTSRMMPTTTTSRPQNELESAIQGILQESGLATSDRHRERQDQEGDALPENKPSVEEVMARRAELRRARELLFREEQRSKRIKKIKSKAYRRVHRRQRDKDAQKEMERLADAGLDLSEDDRERNDRRRAEERMGARHRESRWAKAAKKTGQMAWNDDARAGVTEMARRNEELRRRIQGKSISADHEDSEGFASDDGDLHGVGDDGSDSDDGAFTLKMQGELDAAEQLRKKHPGKSKLSSLKFMERAEAAQKRANDEAIASIRRDMARESGHSDSESAAEEVGRRSYGPNAAPDPSSTIPKRPRNELEEGSASEDGEAAEEKPEPAGASSNAEDDWTTVSSKRPSKAPAKASAKNTSAKSHPSNASRTTSTKPEDKKTSALDARPATNKAVAKRPVPTKEPTPDPPSDNDATPAEPDHSSESLLRSAFSTDDADATSFAAEKAATTAAEDAQYDDAALPGWGSWAGAGISRRARRAARPRRVQTASGVAAAKRRDARLADVIVSEKRAAKNARYLAPVLPFPYESRAQYASSMRVPLGREWATKESFAAGTKPRVLVKQGIIRPMEAPMR